MARVRTASNYGVEPIVDWQMTEGSAVVEPDVASAVASLTGWQQAEVPGTVASTLRAAKAWSFDTPKDFDASEYWYRARVVSRSAEPGSSVWLCLGGLATLADVWFNGEHVLRSENMYLEHELDVTARVREQNEIIIRFAALNPALEARRPRPRFRTKLIERQQLRWFRTTFLGRMPSWTPPVVAVGPWRGVRLERRADVSIGSVELVPSIEADTPLVRASVAFERSQGAIESVVLHVGAHSAKLSPRAEQPQAFAGQLQIPDAERWWPNGHGTQSRYPSRLVVTTVGGQHTFELDAVAFRSVEAAPGREGLALLVNGREVRCRGACWTPTDVVSLGDDAATLATLRLARDAGMNMVRVGGTMIYESDAFYEECDRLGILVWQDYMFANCDYPADDAAFVALVTEEARQFHARTQARACIAVLCGGSEVEQQISMLGLPREMWKPPLFHDTLRALSHDLRPDVPYLTSSPTGTGLPFQADRGVTHYYGVGAYLRPLEDARRADVKFASECLAFANVPEPQTVETLLAGKAPFHDPRWKLRVPRDNGPGWDFDDVRDFYVKLLFGVDPVLLRYQDPERALALGRVASGEVMASTLVEWRRAASNCRGSLIWLLRDLWPGAGWGIIDANGVPKAAYYYVKRALQPRVVFLTDEGVNGLTLHVVNDDPRPLEGDIDIVLWKTPGTQIAAASTSVSIAPFGTHQVACAELFEHFIDLTHAYRFGPPAYDVAVASVRGQTAIADAHYFVNELPSHAAAGDGGLVASGSLTADGTLELRVSAASFAQAVAIDVPGFVADDSYFNLCPGQQRSCQLRPLALGAGAKPAKPAKPRGQVHALNAHAPARISVVIPETTP